LPKKDEKLPNTLDDLCFRFEAEGQTIEVIGQFIEEKY
jgi:hypothetical protein